MPLYQDYKEFFEHEFELEYHDIHVVREQINELITALEAAQAEADNCEKRVDELTDELDEAKSVLIGQREDRRFDRKRLVKIDKENHGLRKELDEVKSKAWKTVDLEEGNMLVFVGVHVVAWQQSWGQPSVGFTRWNDED